MRKIRKVSLTPKRGGDPLSGFIFDETQSEYEVLLVGPSLEVLFFDRGSLTDRDDTYQMSHAETS